MRWEAPDGVVWASRYEYEVYLGMREAGHNVRKTTEKDSMGYSSPVRGGICLKCGSSEVAQQHSYTADLFVDTSEGTGRTDHDAAGYHVESKGYLRAPQRALLRYLRKAQPNVDLRLVVQRDYRISKSSTIVGWAKKYLKVPVVVWGGLRDGRFPEWR